MKFTKHKYFFVRLLINSRFFNERLEVFTLLFIYLLYFTGEQFYKKPVYFIRHVNNTI